MDNVSLLAAFGAGILTFLSPCVLPLIPGYIAFMTGLSASELTSKERSLSAVLVPPLLFVLGFTLVFTSLGAGASAVGRFLLSNRQVFETAAGVVFILLGFFMLGIVKVPWLYGEARFEMGKARRFGSLAALVMGMAFAFGWTPCVGPILSVILTMAMDSGSVGRGAFLLAVYSLGLGVPFVAVALLLGRIRPVLDWLNRHSIVINRIAGVIVMAVGILILTGWLSRVVGFLS